MVPHLFLSGLWPVLCPCDHLPFLSVALFLFSFALGILTFAFLVVILVFLAVSFWCLKFDQRP